MSLATVTPIRRPQERTEPTPVRQTVAQMFAAGTVPEKGDYVFSVALKDDETGGVAVTVPGSGRVRGATHSADHTLVTLTFDFGLTLVISGGSEVLWYPNPAKEN